MKLLTISSVDDLFSNQLSISDSWEETFYIFLAYILSGTVPLINSTRHSGSLCSNAWVKLKSSRFLNVITARYILNHAAFFPSSFIAAAASEAGDPRPGNLILSLSLSLSPSLVFIVCVFCRALTRFLAKWLNSLSSSSGGAIKERKLKVLSRGHHANHFQGNITHPRMSFCLNWQQPS